MVTIVSLFPVLFIILGAFLSLLQFYMKTLICSFFSPNLWSAKLIDTYRTKHNITASSGSTDPTVLATGISDLIYESTQPAPAASNSSGLDDDLVNAWAANLGDDGLLGNNAPAMSRVSCLSLSDCLRSRISMCTVYIFVLMLNGGGYVGHYSLWSGNQKIRTVPEIAY